MNKNQISENLAVCSWSLRPKDTVDLVAMIHSLGLSKVQLALNDHRGSAGGAAIGRELADAGIEIISGMFGTEGEDYSTPQTIQETGGVVPDHTWKNNQVIARNAAEAAQALGLDLVSFHAGFLPHDREDPAYAKLIDRLRFLANLFAERGLKLSFETGQEEASSLAAFLKDLEAPNVGVNFDPANMILYDKGDPVEGLRTLLPYLQQVHIKDAIVTDVPGTWGSEVVVGTGQVDWPAFFAVLDEGNYDGALVIEREAGDDRVGDIRAAKEFLLNL
ncbi:MAG: sugar phosphate isomerase/epimerase [Verrucomicrobiae bacterium]|nr:sugar phosphate isomerase/epimerase [Verrucomicrobiae bacterium]